MTQTIQLWVEDKPGVLMRVVGIITAKGANIRSLLLRPDANQAGISEVTLVAEIEPRLNRRVLNEMNRLVQVLLAVDASEQQPGCGCEGVAAPGNSLNP